MDGIKLYIYILNGCKVCGQREGLHDELSNILKTIDIEVVDVKFGNVDGKTYYPLQEHDHLCRKPSDPSKYVAPVYVLVTDNSDVKLKDIGDYPNAYSYAQYVEQVLDQASTMNQGQ